MIPTKLVITTCFVMAVLNCFLAAILAYKGAYHLTSIQLFWALFNYGAAISLSYLDSKPQPKPIKIKTQD